MKIAPLGPLPEIPKRKEGLKVNKKIEEEKADDKNGSSDWILKASDGQKTIEHTRQSMFAQLRQNSAQ